jgi:hypothetical protein
LRHQDKLAEKGRSPYEMWRDQRTEFDCYQSVQRPEQRSKLNKSYWASFVATPNNETMFVGLYAVKYRGLSERDILDPCRGGIILAGSYDLYNLTLATALSDLVGRLFIDWGPAPRAWIQRADRMDKTVTELRTEFKEPDFPGFLHFVEPLSRIGKLPKSWITALQFSKGVYLLTCPKTKEQYVGSASGGEGFWYRWQCYVQDGHGGNVALKSREPSDYQVSILEVAGTAATTDDILAMEQRWKRKLQSMEMGLNRN